MASLNESPILERYLNGCHAIFTIIDGKYIIMTPEENYEYDTFAEMMKDIEYTVNEWDRLDVERR